MFPTPLIDSVRSNQVPSFLTSSNQLQQKTKFVDCVSGAIVGRGIILYRYDENDEAKGFPVNVDLYLLSGAILYKVQPPFSEHWLGSSAQPVRFMGLKF